MGVDKKINRQLIFNRKTVFMNILVICLFIIAFWISSPLGTQPDPSDRFSLIFLDSSARMGYGTTFTPVLLILGFDPLQIIPVVMVQ